MERTIWRLKHAMGAGAGGAGPITFGGGHGFGAGSVLGMLLGGGTYRPTASGLSQIPQLSASQPFDLNRPFTI